MLWVAGENVNNYKCCASGTEKNLGDGNYWPWRLSSESTWRGNFLLVLVQWTVSHWKTLKSFFFHKAGSWSSVSCHYSWKLCELSRLHHQSDEQECSRHHHSSPEERYTFLLFHLFLFSGYYGQVVMIDIVFHYNHKRLYIPWEFYVIE